MAELLLPNYCADNIARVSDLDMIYIIKELIDSVMIENRIYLDDDDRAHAIEVIYPVIACIVFNTNFAHIRADEKILLDLIACLVVRLS